MCKCIKNICLLILFTLAFCCSLFSLPDTVFLGSSTIAGYLENQPIYNNRSLSSNIHIQSGMCYQILGFLDLEEPLNYNSNGQLQIQIVVSKDATLILGKQTDTLPVDAEFHVRRGTRLVIEKGGRLVIENGSQIIVEAGGELVIDKDAIIESYSSMSIDLIDIDSLLSFIDDSSYQQLPETNPSWLANDDTVYINQLLGLVDVSAIGGLTYTIPISLAPGTSGVQPHLAIVYNSQSGRSLVGKNIAISGLSSIIRTNKNFYFNNVQSGISMTSGDVLMLDGQRLINIGSGSSRSGDDLYDTEFASFSEIVSYGSNTSGAQSFKVYAKDGTLLEYGNNVNSRVTFQTNKVYQYLLNKQQDANGNYIEYEYYNSGGSVQIKEICYTGTTNFAPYNKVVFSYYNSPNPRDLYVTNSGDKLVDNKLLSTITCYAENVVYRTYRMYYDNDNERLDAIRLFDVNDSLIGELRFNWTTSNRSFESNTKWIQHYGTDVSAGQWGNVHLLTLADVNGDGKADIVGFSDNGVNVSFSIGNTFATSVSLLSGYFSNNSGWTQSSRPRYVQDINGDGLADILGFGAAGVDVSLSTGTGFSAPTQWTTAYSGSSGWSSVKRYPRHIADFNGDGLPDIIGVSTNGIVINLNNVSSGNQNFGGGITKPVFSEGQGFNYDEGDYSDYSAVADINGDGRADIIVIKNTGSSHNHTYTMSYALSNGTSVGDAVQVSSTYLDWYGESFIFPKTRKFNFFFADVNGDGKADYIHTISNGIGVELSTGNGFTSVSQWTNMYGGSSDFKEAKYRMMMQDVNGDGMSDIIAFATDGVHVLLSTGSSFVYSGIWNANPIWKGNKSSSGNVWGNEHNFATFADVNGDAKVDLVGFVSDGVYVSKDKADDRASLISVKDNLGSQFTATYDLLTNSSIYTKEIPPSKNQL